MSDIRITLPDDKTPLILKRIQNRISSYKGYKAGADARESSQALCTDIEKRVGISLTNFQAAIDNLEMYEKQVEKSEAEKVYSEIAGLKSKKIVMPSEPFLVAQEDILNFYLLDEVGFKNSIDLLDNINSFRSASISGEFDPSILEKIRLNIGKIENFLDGKNQSLKPKP